MPRRKPRDASEEGRGMGVGASPQAPTQTPTEGEQRQEPLYYVVSIKMRIDADRQEAKELIERLKNLEYLDVALDDVDALLLRAQEVLPKAMSSFNAERLRRFLSDALSELKESRRRIFTSLADMGVIVELKVDEGW